jgi:nitrogen regulatory protein PII
MHLVVAVLKPSQVEIVRQALVGVHVTRLTVCDAQGYDGPLASASVVQQAVMEIAVNDDFVDRTVDAVAAALGPPDEQSSARLFLLPMHEAVQIYREVRGPEAV